MERSHKREGIDMTYLKNVILKLLETGTRKAQPKTFNLFRLGQTMSFSFRNV